jgi:hypothetical protein
MPREQQDWRSICEAASKEQDSETLIALVSELMKILDKSETPQNNTQAA